MNGHASLTILAPSRTNLRHGSHLMYVDKSPLRPAIITSFFLLPSQIQLMLLDLLIPPCSALLLLFSLLDDCLAHPWTCSALFTAFFVA